MRELEKIEVVNVTGGVATGWVPAYWLSLGRHLGFEPIIGSGPAPIPGIIPGPIFMPGAVALGYAPSTPVPGLVPGNVSGTSDWEC